VDSVPPLGPTSRAAAFPLVQLALHASLGSQATETLTTSTFDREDAACEDPREVALDRTRGPENRLGGADSTWGGFPLPALSMPSVGKRLCRDAGSVSCSADLNCHLFYLSANAPAALDPVDARLASKRRVARREARVDSCGFVRAVTRR